MATEITTLMDYEAGNLSIKEKVEMVASMIESGELDNLPEKFTRLANQFKRKEIIDDEGNINYIKLSMEE